MYPVFSNKISNVTIDADNADIRRAIVAAVPLAKKQLALLAKTFKGATNRETCQNIYRYLYSRKYVEDGEEQIVKFPSAIIQENIVSDCKSFALFTAGILENLQIPYKFTLTSYNDNPIPQHIYVTTNDGIIIDAVWGKSGGMFNSEKKYNYKYEIPMNVKYMSGIGCPSKKCGCGIENCRHGVGNIFDKVGNWVKEKVDDAADKIRKAENGAKTVALAPGRLLFKAMVAGNLDGIATGLSKMDQNSVRTLWNKVGGNITSLNKDIENGKRKKAIEIGFLGKLKKTIGISGCFIGASDDEIKKINDAIIVIAPSLGALVGSVVPGVGTAIGAGGGLSLGVVLTQLTPIIMELVKNSKSEKSNLETKIPDTRIVPDGTNPDEPTTPTKFNFTRDFWEGTPLFGIKGKNLVAGAIVLTTAAFFAKKKKII